MKQLIGALRCLASTDWGYEKSISRSTYIAMGRLTVEHTTAAWLPWVLNSMMEKLKMCQRYAGRAISGQIMTTHAKKISAQADIPTVATGATQLSTIAMEKSLWMPDTNPRNQIATADVRQPTKKKSLRKKASEAWRSILGSIQPERTLGLLPPWLQTGNHIFYVDGARLGETEKDKIWALHRLTEDRSSYDLTIYTDGLATNGTAIGGGGILVTAGHLSNPTIHHPYAIPASTWCLSFQAEMKAIKKALQIHRTEKSTQKVLIVSDSQSVLLSIANIQPAIPFKSAYKSDILSLHADLHDEGHQINLTWCPSHCRLVGNEMAYERAQKELQPINKMFYTTATVRRPPSGLLPEREISYERICRVYGMKEEKLDRRKESKSSRKEQTTIGHLRSGHQPDLKYWLHKIERTVDTICWKCGIGEDTSEHILYDCPRILHPPHEPTPPDTVAKDPQNVMRI